MLATLSCLGLLAPTKPMVLAHYMPWYAAPPVSREYGWHWTMDKFKPAEGELASHYAPEIGAYDSGDADVIEYQLLMMKTSGINGIIVDWYGTRDVYDYAMLHRNTQRVVTACERFGMKFAICYEDQSLRPAVEKGVVSDALAEFKAVLDRLEAGWFSSEAYAKLYGKPILLMFGPQYLTASQVRTGLEGRAVTTFGVLGTHEALDGGFGWPEPQVGDARSFDQLSNFYDRAEAWPTRIGVVYPRFHDIYKDAGVHDSLGRIADDDGETFARTLSLAVRRDSPIIQIATWNDWGEGTQIEPSKEFGTRDLEVLQTVLHGEGFDGKAADLELPLRLYRLRKAGKASGPLNRIAESIATGFYDRARRELEAIDKSSD